MLRDALMAGPGLYENIDVKRADPSRMYDSEYPPRNTGSDPSNAFSLPRTVGRNARPTLGATLFQSVLYAGVPFVYCTNVGVRPVMTPGLNRLPGPEIP